MKLQIPVDVMNTVAIIALAKGWTRAIDTAPKGKLNSTVVAATGWLKTQAAKQHLDMGEIAEYIPSSHYSLLEKGLCETRHPNSTRGVVG